jgi:hypothetical protein
MSMSQNTRKETLPRLRQRYAGRVGKGKTALINEVCEQWGYNRKHAIKLLNAKAGWGGSIEKRKGRPPLYGKEVEKVLWKLWKVAEQPCGKRLAAMIELWLPYYQKEYGQLEGKLQEQVLTISPAQIDRLLAPRKATAGVKSRCGTRPGGILKTQIPIRTDNWDVTQPGFLEADTVAHCGGSLEGDFIWSVTYTDIFSGWTANRGIWNKGAEGVVKATHSVESLLPFEVLGFDCDNGSEFLNHHLVRYFQERSKKVGFTRSRPYHKNDNAYVEQKNWTHVRQLFGYDRFGEMSLLPLVNEIYTDVCEPLSNFFKPCMKLLSKERHGAKIKRRYDKPQTPCDRLLQSEHISEEMKGILRAQRARLNPLDLSRKLEEKLRALHYSLRSSRPTDSLSFASNAGILPPTLPQL